MKQHTEFYSRVLNNLRKIMNDKGVTQAAMGDAIGVSESSMSKIFTGQATLTIDHLANLASHLSISVADIILYGEDKRPEEPVEAILQIRLRKEKKDQVLRLVFGDNNIEILNK